MSIDVPFPELEQLRFEDDLEAYVLCVEPVQTATGGWAYLASYPELPDVHATARTALEAIDLVDRLRDEYVRAALGRGEPLPLGWSSGRRRGRGAR